MNYKLIKTYPDSPELGYISKPKISKEKTGHYWSGSWFEPEDYPEFWEPCANLEYFKDFKYIKFLKDFDYAHQGEVFKIKYIDFEPISSNYWITYTLGGFRIIGYNPTSYSGYRENEDFIFLTEKEVFNNEKSVNIQDIKKSVVELQTYFVNIQKNAEMCQHNYFSIDARLYSEKEKVWSSNALLKINNLFKNLLND